MFRTGGYSSAIESREITRTTDRKVFYNYTSWHKQVTERQEMKSSMHHQWHNSWEDAHQCMIKSAKASIKYAEEALVKAKANLLKVEALTPEQSRTMSESEL